MRLRLLDLKKKQLVYINQLSFVRSSFFFLFLLTIEFPTREINLRFRVLPRNPKRHLAIDPVNLEIVLLGSNSE